MKDSPVMVHAPPEHRALREPGLKILRNKYDLRGLVESEPPHDAFFRIARETCVWLHEQFGFSPLEIDIREWIAGVIAKDDCFIRHVEALDDVNFTTRNIEELATATAGTVIQAYLESQDPIC
jgi:hypothetical protein